MLWQGVLGKAPEFLQPWQRRMLLAGVQLRLLRFLPAHLNALSDHLIAIAGAEVAQCSAACAIVVQGTPCCQTCP